MDDSRAVKNSNAISRALQSVGQNTVAEALGRDESLISAMKNQKVRKAGAKAESEIEFIGRFLAACGIKTVPEEMRCYRPDSIQAILTLAHERMKQIEHPDELLWEE